MIFVTVTVVVAVFIQPLLLVPVTVYVLVAVELQVNNAPVEALNPVAGDQLYVVAPDADTVVEEPLHIVDEPIDAITIGKGLTVIDCVVVFVQPAELVPVTV